MYAVFIFFLIKIYILASKCGVIFWQKSSELYLKFNKMNVWNKILGYFSSFFNSLVMFIYTTFLLCDSYNIAQF